jgi:hypothetical protein
LSLRKYKYNRNKHQQFKNDRELTNWVKYSFEPEVEAEVEVKIEVKIEVEVENKPHKAYKNT